MRDELFKRGAKKQFEFDREVASVFDDMIERSVPFYRENLELCAELLSCLACAGARVCDLGCASANFLLALFQKRPDLVLSGVDSAAAMLEFAKNKAAAYGARIEFFEKSLDALDFFQNDIFIATYTLQFIRPPKRQALVDKIYQNLSEGGVFLMSEKILYEGSKMAKNINDIHEKYKQKQGYSLLEIAAKREALENVLVPYSEGENLALLKHAGFERVEILFKWANFETFIAFKGGEGGACGF